MVWSPDREAERPALSVILPRFYLGGESDVTQDQLASLGISHVLSVSRCSPQPSFLPHSRYLRIPIDDSLWDDLLPWIPKAIHFIDAAMSSGGSVLIHCAAGISRSPALAVAYIMYSLGMDLDHAYRFVKERRPSISPNFNFLGQLQHFQGTLGQKGPGGGLVLKHRHTRLPSNIDSGSHTYISQRMNHQTDRVTGKEMEVKQAEKKTVYHIGAQQRQNSDENGNPYFSLSGKLQTLHQNKNQQKIQTPCKVSAKSSSEPIEPVLMSTQCQLLSGSASLLEKRKSLTLSLTPLGISSPPTTSSRHQARDTTMPKTVHNGKIGWRPVAKTQRNAASSWQTVDIDGGQSPTPHSSAEVKEQGLLSPFSFSLNRLLGWGERVLLGRFCVHTGGMAQPALPYRC